MTPEQSRALEAMWHRANAEKKWCDLCGAPKTGLGTFFYPLPNGKQRIGLFGTCNKCMAEARDPDIGEATRDAILRRLQQMAEQA